MVLFQWYELSKYDKMKALQSKSNPIFSEEAYRLAF